MRYGSVCSGIEAASVAWHPLGWKAAFLSEIEAFPRAVLRHHYPDVPLHGDFTTIQAGDYEPIDLLVGGTPCQSFSVAGLRGGLADERGNLALEYLRLAQRLRPRWLLWENVPGVLSSISHDAPDPGQPPDDMEEGAEWVGEDEYDADESHAFSCFLAGLSELGYGFAYRVLDAQFFGLAQRRNRVFVVGYLGDWRRAAAVLFEPASLRWDSPPRREAGEGTTGTLSARASAGGGLGTDFECSGGVVGRCLNAYPNRSDGESETFITVNCSPAIRAKANDSHRADSMAYVAHSLRAEGFDASEDGTGRGTPLVACEPIPLLEVGKRTGASTTDLRAGSGFGEAGDPMFTLQAGAQHGVALAFDARQSDVIQYGDQSGPLDTDGHSVGVLAFQDRFRGDDGRGYDRPPPTSTEQAGTLETVKPWYVATRAAVRRLTPRECARLQGFPDDYLDITYRGKPAADGNKYRALGNSFAVPVVRWIGERIAAQEAEIQAQRQQAAA